MTDEFYTHRPDCPFSFAPLNVCDCLEKNLRDRIEADAKRIEELEDALRELAFSTGCCDACPCHMKATRKARAALEGEKK